MNNYTQSPDEVKEWKRQKLDAIRQHHMDLIKDLEISPLDFNMKMPFYDDRKRQVIGIFASEFKKEKGFYFELVTRNLDPLDTERRVYRVPFNSAFDEEYELNEKGSYLVPLDELRVVNPAAVAISKGNAVASFDKVFNSKTVAETPAKPQEQLSVKADSPYSEMTIRDFIAIHTGKPVSLKPWINELVSKPNNNLPF
jgi:hypothetical protein